jgi:hypothetical protein
MPAVTYTIDDYSVEILANDLRGSLTRWAAAVIHLYSGGKMVGQAYFAYDSQNAPDGAYSGGTIFFPCAGRAV